MEKKFKNPVELELYALEQHEHLSRLLFLCNLGFTSAMRNELSEDDFDAIMEFWLSQQRINKTLLK